MSIRIAVAVLLYLEVPGASFGCLALPPSSPTMTITLADGRTFDTVWVNGICTSDEMQKTLQSNPRNQLISVGPHSGWIPSAFLNRRWFMFYKRGGAGVTEKEQRQNFDNGTPFGPTFFVDLAYIAKIEVSGTALVGVSLPPQERQQAFAAAKAEAHRSLNENKQQPAAAPSNDGSASRQPNPAANAPSERRTGLLQFVGVWSGETATAVMYVKTRLVLRADGTYTKTFGARPPTMGGGEVGAPTWGDTHSGTWTPAGGMMIRLSGDEKHDPYMQDLSKLQKVQ